jgi:restriction endonuclease S subunit
LKDLNNFLIALPSINEQGRIAAELKRIIDSIQILIINLNKAKSVKVGLMQDLLSGKVGVHV